MKIPARNDRGRLHFNMTPMIDVVFLLIIFFLVSSHLARQEVQAEVDLPEAATGSDPPSLEAPRLTLNVLARDGEFVWMLGSERLTPETLERSLQQQRQRQGENLEVRIRTDQRIPYERIEPILLACVRQGIWNVTFAVVARED